MSMFYHVLLLLSTDYFCSHPSGFFFDCRQEQSYYSPLQWCHMSIMVSEITSNMTFCSTVHSFSSEVHIKALYCTNPFWMKSRPEQNGQHIKTCTFWMEFCMYFDENLITFIPRCPIDYNSVLPNHPSTHHRWVKSCLGWGKFLSS